MHTIRAWLATGILVFSPFAAGQALALQSPHAIATDSRIQTLRYNENEVYKFLGHYGYQTIIEFSPGEEIGTISIGDSVAWQVNPIGNRLFIKPIEQDATTNMAVITSKHIYQFELHAEETDDIRDKNMIFLLRFLYPDQDSNEFSGLSGGGEDAVPDLSDAEVRAKLNFNYSIVGPDTIAPIRIFDDGEFTYFEFRNKNGDLPAFFDVDRSGNESLINFRKSGNYIVVERVSSRFTLRHGPDIICVFNEAMPPAPPPVPVNKPSWYQFWRADPSSAK